MLLEAGADPTIPDNMASTDGTVPHYTPMDVARGLGHQGCISLLQVSDRKKDTS